MRNFADTDWAVILGGSSGCGLAAAKKLARHGMSVCIVHRDLRGAMARVSPEFDTIKVLGRGFVAVNANALTESGRTQTLDALRTELGDSGRVKLFLHSIAAGNLKPLVAKSEQEATPVLEDEDFAHTVYAMGTSLATWVRSLYDAGLFADDARVLSLTAEGSHVAWPGYAAVSAAKAALEAVTRSLAVELGPRGVRCNAIQAGISDTPALRRLVAADQLKRLAKARNPFGRLTRPEDVADFICLMATPEAAWVNGAILTVDGGESIAGSARSE